LWVLFGVKVTFIPADFAIIGDEEFTAAREGDANFERFHDLWDEFVFLGFGVHEG
jgi:hypothetical protein